MSGRVTAILAVVLAVLALGYAGLLRWERQSRQEEFRAKRLFDFDTAEVEGLRLSREGEPTVAARRTDDTWAIVEPHPIPANPDPWRQMAEAVAGLTNERTVADEDAAMADFGLDAPGLVIRVEAGDQEHALAFGKATPMQDRRYARLDDGPVILVRNAAYAALDRSLLDLRDRSLVSAPTGAITRVELNRLAQDDSGEVVESQTVAVEKRDGRWHLVEPVQVAANSEVVGNLVAMLEQTPGRDFVDAPESLADYKLDVPRMRVTAWTDADSDPRTVYFGGLTPVTASPTGGREQGVYVKRADAPYVFVVPATIIQFFPEKPDAYRDRRLFTHQATRIDELRVSSDLGEAVVMDDPRTGWKLEEPEGVKPDAMVISSYINALKRIEAEAFLDVSPAEVGLDRPVAAAEIVLAGGPTVRVAVGGPGPEEDTVYALQDTGSVVLVPAGAVELLQIEPFAFQAKEIFEFPKDNAVRLVLHFEGVDYEFRLGDDGKWVVSAPPGKRWELSSDMEALLRAVNPVRALARERSAEPEDLASFGLDAPLLRVEVFRPSRFRGEDEGMAGPLEVGSPAPDESLERFARVAGRPGVFRVSQALIDEVREALKGIRDSEP